MTYVIRMNPPWGLGFGDSGLTEWRIKRQLRIKQLLMKHLLVLGKARRREVHINLEYGHEARSK